MRLIHGDCLEELKKLENNSIDLVLIDPPYNIGKDKWDKWKTVGDYVAFMGSVFKELERVLKANGSFYFFHNDFLQIVELQNFINNNTEFKFKCFLVWNKRYSESPKKYYFDNVIKSNADKNYRQLAEYCLYYTFQDGTGLDRILKEQDFSSIMEYFYHEKKKTGLNYKQLDELMGIKASFSYWDKKTTHQYRIPEQGHYEKLQETGFFKKPYEELRAEYEGLREGYESQRYVFNNLKQHHSVINCEIAPKQGHTTPKPVELLEYLIKTSSNEGDIVLDCFMGSGSTGVACKNTNRHFIGIELDEKYYEIAKNRIEEESE